MPINYQFLETTIDLALIQQQVMPLVPPEMLTRTNSLVCYPPDIHICLRANHQLVQELDRLGVTDFWNMTALVVARPNGSMTIHTDTGAYVWSINIPLHNTDDAHTVFYQTTDMPVMMPTNQGSESYLKYTVDNCVEVERFKLTAPVLMRTDVPHSVVNTSSMPRLALGLRLSLDFDPAAFF